MAIDSEWKWELQDMLGRDRINPILFFGGSRVHKLDRTAISDFSADCGTVTPARRPSLEQGGTRRGIDGIAQARGTQRVTLFHCGRPSYRLSEMIDSIRKQRHCGGKSIGWSGDRVIRTCKSCPSEKGRKRFRPSLIGDDRFF